MGVQASKQTNPLNIKWYRTPLSPEQVATMRIAPLAFATSTRY
jgi:hypothetical protein